MQVKGIIYSQQAKMLRKNRFVGKIFGIASLLWAMAIHAQVELPAHLPSDEIIKHEGYALKYNEEHEQPDWVAYQLTKKEVYGKIKRTDNFREDPSVKTGSATLEDYKNSGYDRGHLIPASDAKYSKKAMSDTFYLSNISPMIEGFNRGIWSSLERKVRDWAVENEEIYVVTGPVLTKPPLAKIGKNSVSVPSAYYKVILDNREPELKAIAFILPHKLSKKALAEFAMSVDEAEAITGLDFFPELPEEIENRLESTYDLHKWGIARHNEIPYASVDWNEAMLYVIMLLAVVAVTGTLVLGVGMRMGKKQR